MRREKNAVVAAMLGAALALTASTASLAQSKGLYMGASMGRSKVDIDTADLEAQFEAARAAAAGAGAEFTGSVSADEKDRGWKLFLGYKFGRYFALEGGYVDLGAFESSSIANTTSGGTTTTAESRVTLKAKQGGHVSALLMFPMTDQFSLFGRLGAYSVRTTVESSASAGPTGSESKRGAGVLFGFGAGYEINESASLRLEWERYSKIKAPGDAEKFNVDVIAFGLLFGF